jgi:hypothetical protein
MSVLSLPADFVGLDDNVDVSSLFTILDNLVDVSFDDSDP